LHLGLFELPLRIAPPNTGYLRRWFASNLAATYLQYVSLDLRQTALHLGALEQPLGIEAPTTAHLRRWFAGYPPEMGALAATYLQYA
jgi:hypothetical protein